MINVKDKTLFRSLVFLTILCVTLQICRLSTQNNTKYSFLIWNLILAWIPFVLTAIAQKYANQSKWKVGVVLLFWLLFFPNSPYIITDLLHLKSYGQNIIWFDSLLIFVFAMTGFLVSLNSLQVAHHIFITYFEKNLSWILIVFIAFLSGFGIYLGRYCRLNSWDLLNQPLWFFERIIHQFDNPLSYQVTLTYGFVIFCCYWIFWDARKIQSKD